jgi:uncharacterized coiled-coil DUF342 family protein
VNALTEEIEKIKEGRQKVQEQIDGAMSDPVSKAALQEARTKMNGFKTQKGALIEEKKAMRAQLDQAKNQTEKIMKDKKDARNNVRFNSLQEIEAEIKKLQTKQETTSMSLGDEKKLVMEITQLQSSKQFVADLKSKDAAMDNVKEQRKTIGQQIAAKDKEIDALSKEIDDIMIIIKAMNETDSTKRDGIQALFKERDEFKKQMGSKLKEKDSIRDEFRTQNNAWYNMQRAVRAQKQLQYESEKEQRAEEKKAHLALMEEEEAKKIPYEAEQALCDFLADYLERTYLGKSEEKEEKKVDVVVVKDDPFAGMVASKKKDEDSQYFGKGKTKKKRVRAAKSPSAGPFTVSVDSFEQFGLIKMSPPTSVDQVANSVKELREKKEWYKVQPRGSVKTAEEIRKANQKGAAKQRQATEAEAEAPSSAPKAKGPSNFSLSNEDFAPLGAGGAAPSMMISSWGQNQAIAEPTEMSS